MNAIKTWFTPARREAIYAAVAALAPILVTAGVLADNWLQPILVITSAVLQAVAGIIALSNLTPTDASRWFGTVGRGIIYGGATTVAAAVVATGLITQDFATNALTGISFGLTALAALLGVVTPKEVEFALEDLPVEADAIVVDGAVVEPVVEGLDTEPVDAVVAPDDEPAVG
jgi:hypothetical protein